MCVSGGALDPAPRQGQVWECIFPEAHQVGIEELAAIVGVQFQHGEGQSLQDALKSVFHDPVAAAQHGPPLAPGGGDIHPLDRMNVIPGRRGPVVMHEIDFKMARRGFVPGDTFHWHVSRDPVGAFRPTPRQPARQVAFHALRHPPHTRHANLPQLRQPFRRDHPLALFHQVLGHPHQVRRQPFCTHVIQTLCNHPHGVPYLGPLRHSTLFRARVAFQVTPHQSNQTLPVQFCHVFHLIQQVRSFGLLSFV